MFISKYLLSGRYLKNGVVCRVGQRISESHSRGKTRACILRVYQDNKGNRELNEKMGKPLDKLVNGKLTRRLSEVKPDFNLGDVLLVNDVEQYVVAALSCCGPKDAKVNEEEGIDEERENLRCCFAAGKRALDLIMGDTDIIIDDNECNMCREGFVLGRWKPERNFVPSKISPGPARDGVRYADAQNWARHLSSQPPNMLTPEDVVQEATKLLSPLKIQVIGNDKKKIEDKKMQAFLAVEKGSSASPYLLECNYTGKSGAPRVLVVAKGVTFDSGGLCLKKPENMLQHGGMTGAAAALGMIYGLALLKVPVDVKLVIPLCENMISGQCLKVGDVVPTMKGLNVKVEDTDLEGHLMLADALTYGQEGFKPDYVMSVASLTPCMVAATGGSSYGCFTKNEDLWRIARLAGIQSGDRPWRFPIWNYYAKQIQGDTDLYNLKNRGSGIASHCIGAAFLENFVSGKNWLHYDITGLGRIAADVAPQYLDPNYMTGRPTRALIDAVREIVKIKR